MPQPRRFIKRRLKSSDFLSRGGGSAGVVATDNFTRADDPTGLGANWIPLRSTVKSIILANQARNDTTGFAFNRWVGAGTFNNDQYAKVTALLGSASQSCCPIIAGSGSVDASTCYSFEVGFGTYILVRRVAEVDTTIASGSVSFNAGDVIEIRRVGTLISAYINGGFVASGNDSVIGAGNPGFNVYGDTTAGATYWEGGNL